MSERETGIVKWFNDSKGLGFVERDGGQGDVFVHHSSITGDDFKTLAEGQKVEFSVTIGDNGQKAEKLKVL